MTRNQLIGKPEPAMAENQSLTMVRDSITDDIESMAPQDAGSLGIKWNSDIYDITKTVNAQITAAEKEEQIRATFKKVADKSTSYNMLPEKGQVEKILREGENYDADEVSMLRHAVENYHTVDEVDQEIQANVQKAKNDEEKKHDQQHRDEVFHAAMLQLDDDDVEAPTDQMALLEKERVELNDLNEQIAFHKKNLGQL